MVNSIIKKTKISPIYTGYEFNTDGRGVNEFLSKKDKIKKDKFDESDIEALRVWAELLSHNDKNSMAQNKAEDILEYILKEYFPENFDVLLPLHDMNMHIIKDMIVRWLEDKEKKDRIEKIQEYRKKILEYRKIIKPIIDNWDKQGLRRYATSRWRESFSEEDLFVSVILDVLKEKEDIKNPSELFNNKIKKMSILIDECCGSAGFSETQESQCNKEQAKFFNGVGNLFFNIFKVSESIAYYKKAVALDTRVAVYHANLGGAYKGLKQWEEAEQSYLEAIKLEPKNAGYYNTLGNLYWEIPNWEKAINAYTTAFELDNQPIYQCNLGLIYGKLREPKWNKMIEHCKKAVDLRRINPTDAFGLDYYYEYLAEGYFKAGRLEEFKDYFEEAGDLKDEPKKKAIIYNRIGNLLAQGGQVQEAIPYYKDAIKLDSSWPIYECNLGLTYGKLPEPDLDKMIEHYNRAVELSRRMPDEYGLGYYYEYLALGYFKANRLREFEELFEKLEDLKDKLEEKARIYNRIGNLFFETYENKKSISYYKKATELAPIVAAYHANLGGAYKGLKQWKEAEQSYLKAAALEPKNAGYHNTLGNLYWEIPNWEKSINEYTEAFKLDNQPIYLCNLGRAYGNLKQFDEMIKHCQKAVDLRIKKENEKVKDEFGLDYYYEFLAEGYFMSGRLAEFEKLFEESGDFKNEQDKKAKIYNRIGNLFFEALKNQAAKSYYENAISLADNIAVYHGNLGLAFKALMQWGDAEAAFKSAASLEPDNAIYQNDLGNVYFERGDYDKAIPYYEKAIKLDPNNQVYRENLEKCKKV